MRGSTLAVALLTVASIAGAVTPGTELYLPSVAHGQGQCVGGICSQWRSDAWIFNPNTTRSASVTIYFHERRASNASPDHVGPLTVAPGETRELADVVLATFNRSAYGALRFVSDIPVYVTGRVYDENVVTNKGAGTAGQFLAGLPAGAAIGEGEWTDVIGVAQDSADIWRTNFGFVETTGHAATLLVELLDSTGLVLASWIPTGADEVGAYGAQQFNVSRIPNAPRGVNQRVRVRVTGGTGKVVAFASRIDNRSGDPSTVEMTLPAPATGGEPPRTGQFDGVLLGQDGTSPNGAVRLAVGESAITSFSVLSGVPCPSDDIGVTVDFSGGEVALDATGSFTTTLAAQAYAAAGGSTAFSTVWTISGSRNADGSFSGTITSVTSGGTNKAEFNYVQCNGTVANRAWQAARTGAGS